MNLLKKRVVKKREVKNRGELRKWTNPFPRFFHTPCWNIDTVVTAIWHQSCSLSTECPASTCWRVLLIVATTLLKLTFKEVEHPSNKTLK